MKLWWRLLRLIVALWRAATEETFTQQQIKADNEDIRYALPTRISGVINTVYREWDWYRLERRYADQAIMLNRISFFDLANMKAKSPVGVTIFVRRHKVDFMTSGIKTMLVFDHPEDLTLFKLTATPTTEKH